jgi:predicted alpha/beta-fold hydrolase
LREWKAVNPGALTKEFLRPPRTLREFDEQFTAPLGGFESADHYYRSCSPTRFLSSIATPTTILASCNDPLAPGEDLASAQSSNAVAKRIERGGHLGFYAKRGADGPRWLDSFVDAWAKASLRSRRKQSF